MSDFVTMSYKPMPAVIADIFMSGAFTSVYVEGPPGSGKTAMTEQVRRLMNLSYRFIIKPGHHEVIDFHGLPVPNHTTLTTDMYPSACLLPATDLKGGVLLVGDEIADANVMIQNLWCQLMFEGGLHNYRLPENTYIMNTGNRVADRSGANRIVTKAANRQAWLTLQPQVEELFDFALANGWAPSVAAFLKLRGGDPINPDNKRKGAEYVGTYFNSFDPTDPAQALKPIFSSSRSWEAVSKLINYVDRTNPRMADADLLPRVASLVGGAVASAYVPFRSEALVMPDPDAIARGDKVPYPKKSSVLWVLTISLVGRATKATFENCYNWLAAGSNREFAILFVKQCFDTKAGALISPAFNKVLQLPDVKQALSAT